MIKKEDYFKTFCKVSRAFGAALGKEKVLELIVDSAVNTMGAKAACLWLAEEDTGRFRAVAQKGLSDKYFSAKLRFEKIFDTVIQEGHLHAKDAGADPRLEDHEGKKAEGIVSMLIVPVKSEDRVIGVLTLYTGERRTFSDDEIEFLKALADQGGIAIQNSLLVERIQTNAKLFLDLASRINSSLDIREILHSLSEETCKALGMKGVVIRLYNSDTGNLDLVASCGLSRQYLDKGPVSAEKSISDAFMGRTAVIEDVSTDDRLQYREETLKEDIASMVCVPIRSRDQIIGVMRLCSDKRRKYPVDFLNLVEAIAHTGALAIQNASMYLTLQRDKERLEEDGWLRRSYF